MSRLENTEWNTMTREVSRHQIDNWSSFFACFVFSYRFYYVFRVVAQLRFNLEGTGGGLRIYGVWSRWRWAMLSPMREPVTMEAGGSPDLMVRKCQCNVTKNFSLVGMLSTEVGGDHPSGSGVL